MSAAGFASRSFVAVVCALALAGVAVSIRMIERGAAVVRPVPVVGQQVATGAGVVAVNTVVRRGRDRVQVAVALANVFRRPLAFSGDDFRLRAGPNGPSVRPVQASPASGTLEPSGSAHLLLDYRTPSRAGSLWLELRSRGHLLVIDLNRAGGHLHGGHAGH